MDDMFFQCNKDAIYVLNSNYSYEEFGHLNLFGSSDNNVLASRQSSYPKDDLYKNKSFCEAKSLPSCNTSQGISSAALKKLFRSSHNEKQQHPGNKQSQLQLQQNFGKFKNNSLAVTNKKCSSVKSAIIAKKTKFWKYLEEEKLKKSSLQILSTTNDDSDREGKLMRNNSVEGNGPTNHTSWSGVCMGTSNNNSKSSSELYREAAQLLGLSCTLCDNCRCLDCQSRYFECDDSDSFSETSFIGDLYYELPQSVQQDCAQTSRSINPCSSQSPDCTENINKSDAIRHLNNNDQHREL